MKSSITIEIKTGKNVEYGPQISELKTELHRVMANFFAASKLQYSNDINVSSSAVMMFTTEFLGHLADVTGNPEAALELSHHLPGLLALELKRTGVKAPVQH